MQFALNAGDIVLVQFPYSDGKEADKPHPALVLDVAGRIVYLAYGTSARVDQASRVPTSIVMTDPDDLRYSSLHKPTAFHLERRARVDMSKVDRRLGRLPSHKFASLYHAAIAAGLMSA